MMCPAQPRNRATAQPRNKRNCHCVVCPTFAAQKKFINVSSLEFLFPKNDPDDVRGIFLHSGNQPHDVGQLFPLTQTQPNDAAARARLSGLRNELFQLIADDDRWYALGFARLVAGSKTVIAALARPKCLWNSPCRENKPIGLASL
jgi:hypothetical protein